MSARVAPVALLALALAGCGKAELARSPYEIIAREPHAEVVSHLPDVTAREWSVARDRLAVLRRGQPDHPYVERVRLAISDPRTGKRYEARGAVAISPGRAARMMLVGPGGTTALDVWVTKDRFRFSVPAINLQKRGGTDPAEARGLPIGMLRWWFLSPLAGRLLLARSTPAESAWILRDGSATVTLRSDGNRFVALRREGDLLEGIEWIARGLVPQGGAHGQYLEGRFGLRVEVAVEEVLTSEPDPEAFADPDEPGTSL
ncbi:MAG TPA: hypothetical protein VLT33_37855 [Labilithrix sp.]|nr:hypothetical protein [Labilithrix sp.]